MSNNLSEKQMKILSLLALRFAGGLLPEVSLSDIMTLNDCNPLSVTEAINTLIEDGHITRFCGEKESFVRIETTGKIIAEQLKNEVPITVREQIAASAAEEIARQRSRASVQYEVTDCADGFTVHLSMTDDGITLMDLKLYAPTRFQANILVRAFSTSPADIYKKIISSMTEYEQ